MSDVIYFELTTITYNRQPIEPGIMHKQPGAKGYYSVMVDGRRVSRNTPHKRPGIYTPLAEIDPGITLTYRQTLPDQEMVNLSTLYVDAVGANYISCQVLKTWQVPKRRKKHAATSNDGPQPSGIFCPPGQDDDQEFSPEMEEVFAFFGAMLTPKKPAVLRWHGRRYQQKSNYFFIFDPDGKKRRGSVFQKVSPEKINDIEKTFDYQGQTFDMISGKSPESYCCKPSPRYKQLA